LVIFQSLQIKGRNKVAREQKSGEEGGGMREEITRERKILPTHLQIMVPTTATSIKSKTSTDTTW
jgi:hypothetical protein